MRNFLALAAFSVLLIAPCRSHADTFVFAPKNNGSGNGAIARFRVNESTGRIKPLSGDTVVSGVRQPLTIVQSVDAHFLYVFHTFDADTDGYNMESETPDGRLAREAHNRPTRIVVFRIEAGGVLQKVQTLTVPGPVGQLAPHPGGRWIYALTDGGAFLIKTVPFTRRAGAQSPLIYVKRVSIRSGMGLVNMTGERDSWWLTFSPQGNYLYDFWGDGFSDHAENYLQRYKIDSASGIPTPDGAEWIDASGQSKTPVPGSVWFFVNRTAFVNGFAQGFYAYPVDAVGRIVARKLPLSLKPANRGMYYMTQELTQHSKLPLVIYRGDSSDPYTIWRVTAPGKVAKVGTFPSAFTGGKWQTSLIAEPNGRFLYETSTAEIGKFSYAVWRLKSKENSATLATMPVSLPQGIGSNTSWVFASMPDVVRSTHSKNRK